MLTVWRCRLRSVEVDTDERAAAFETFPATSTVSTSPGCAEDAAASTRWLSGNSVRSSGAQQHQVGLFARGDAADLVAESKGAGAIDGRELHHVTDGQ